MVAGVNRHRLQSSSLTAEKRDQQFHKEYDEEILTPPKPTGSTGGHFLSQNGNQMQNPNVHKLLANLKHVEETKDGWTAFCPAHEGDGENHKASLSIKATDDGRILAHCHTGCDPQKVILEAGLTWSDCFPPKAVSDKPKRKIVKEYDYTDLDGKLRFQAIRFEPKSFGQRQPDGKNGWIWNLKGITRIPYRLPELAQAPIDRTVFIVEGEKAVDYARSLGLIATCNPQGAGKWLKSYNKHFDKRNVVIFPDSDPPQKNGVIVGAKHAEDIANSLLDTAKTIHILQPDDMQAKWGLDDWFQKGGHNKDDLEKLLADADPFTPETEIITRIDPHPSDPENMDSAFETEEALCRSIGIVPLGETEAGKAVLFGQYHKKIRVVSLDSVKYESLVQIGGLPTVRKVFRNDPPDGCYTFLEAKESLAILTGERTINEKTMRGPGIWFGQDPESDKKSVIAVGSGEMLVMNKATPEREDYPVRDDQVYNLSVTAEPWFEFDELAGMLEKAKDPNWRLKVIEELETIFKKWNYTPSGMDAEAGNQVGATLVISLLMASVAQTGWRRRPQVYITGESNAGKSTMFRLIGGNKVHNQNGLLGSLCIKSSSSTAAGLQQAVAGSAKILMVDEVGSSSDRRKILEMVRKSSAGDQQIKGQANHSHREFTSQHIYWLADIDTGLSDQADQNRFCVVNLYSPEGIVEDLQNSLPNDSELQMLGRKLVACVIASCRQAFDWEEQIVSVDAEVDRRISLNYAVPAAIYAAVSGRDLEYANKTQDAMIKFSSNRGSIHVEKDTDDILEMVMSSVVHVGPGVTESVSQLIQRSKHDPDCIRALEKFGMVITKLDSRVPDGEDYLFMIPKTVTRLLLRDTKWKGKTIREMLERIPGAVARKKLLSGSRSHGIFIPLTEIKKDEPEVAIAKDLFQPV